jgi:RNA polymerase sigma factor (sigma-70 family)
VTGQTKLLQILDHDGARLHTLLYRLTVRRDVAEDLLQELFLSLSRSRDFSDARDPAAYARRTAINLALLWRRRRRETQAPADCPIAADMPPPIAGLIRAEEVERVLDALSGQSELSQQCFVLRHIEQESYESIAARLGKTSHQVRGICHAAVRQIRDCLGVTPTPQRQVADA